MSPTVKSPFPSRVRNPSLMASRMCYVRDLKDYLYGQSCDFQCNLDEISTSEFFKASEIKDIWLLSINWSLLLMHMYTFRTCLTNGAGGTTIRSWLTREPHITILIFIYSFKLFKDWKKFLTSNTKYWLSSSPFTTAKQSVLESR